MRHHRGSDRRHGWHQAIGVILHAGWTGGQHAWRIEAFGDLILATVDAEKDISLVELADMLRHEHGASFAPGTICVFSTATT